MLQGQIILGIGLILTGLVLLLLLRVFLHAQSQTSLPAQATPEPSPPSEHAANQHEAVLIIAPGGYIREINQAARELFNLPEGAIPDIEWLSRRAKPTEGFLEICARESHSHLTIKNNLVAASSYRIPGHPPAMLVTMQQIYEPAHQITSPTSAVSEFRQAIGANLEQDSAIQSVLLNVERVIPADFYELKLFQPSSHSPTTFTLAGEAGKSRTLQHEKNSQFDEYTPWLIANQQALLIADTQAHRQAEKNNIIRSYLGIPLQMDENLTGTLEMGRVQAKQFGRDDLALLQSITGAISLSLSNAAKYETLTRWHEKNTALTMLASKISSASNLHALFSSVVMGLSTLIDAEIAGFLLFDENHLTLQGQIPFLGLPNNIVEIYKTTAEAQKHFPHTISHTENASQDEHWAQMGLQDVALAAAMHDTTLFPLISQEELLGYLQVSNHHNQKLPPEETHLLNIISLQTAAAVHTILLHAKAQSYAGQITALQKIARHANSAPGLDDLLINSIKETALLFLADVCAIFIMDENSGIMQAHIPSAYGVPQKFIKPLSRLVVRPPAFKMTVAGSMKPFVSANLPKDRRVLPIYRAIVRNLKICSALVVPIIIHEHGMGELMLGAFAENQFSTHDLLTAETIASQLGTAMNAFLHTGETDITLNRQINYLLTLNKVTRELNATSNLNDLANILHEECLAISGATCGAITLFAPEHTGKTPQQEIIRVGDARQDTLTSTATNNIRLIAECDAEEIPHTGIQSALKVPITHQDMAYGSIELHGATARQFDELVLETLKNTGIQAALATGKLLKISQQQKRLESLSLRNEINATLHEIAQNFQSDHNLSQATGAICKSILRIGSFECASIGLYDENTGKIAYSIPSGISTAIMDKIQAHTQSWVQVSQLFKPEHKTGHIYFIPCHEAPFLLSDFQTEIDDLLPAREPAPCHPHDAILIPIRDEEQNPVCIIYLSKKADGLPPGKDVLEMLEIFATTGAETIIRAIRQKKDASLIARLSTQLEQQTALLALNQNSLPVLLHKDLEQTLAINQLWDRTRHIYASLKITEAISRQIDSATAIRVLGEQILTEFSMSQVIIARQMPDGPRIEHIIGSIPGNLNLQTSFGLRNPLRTCLQMGETIVCSDTRTDATWQDSILLNNLGAISFICLPITGANGIIAAVLATDSEIMPALTSEDSQIYHQVGRQVSVILQNIDLLHQTRQHLQEVNLLLDFTRRLNGINATEILITLLNTALQAIHPAHAGVSFIWHAAENLLLPVGAKNYIDDARMMEICYQIGEGLPGMVIAKQTAHRLEEINFARDYNLTTDNLMKYRQATGGRVPVSCLLAPIQSGEQLFGAIILDNFNTPSAFSADNEAILLSLSQQAALSMQNLRLMRAAQERNNQLSALNTTAASLASSLKRDDLISILLKKFANIIPSDTSILWMRQGDSMIVSDARGFEDNEERKGVSVKFAESALLNEMTRTGEAIVVNDVRGDARFSSLLEHKYLSWMGVPLIIKSEVIGVLACEKKEANYYSADLIQIAETFASQAAVALDNATLFEESNRRATDLNERSERLGMLNSFSAELGGALSAEEVLGLTARKLMTALHASQAMLMLLDKNNRNYLLSVLPNEAHHSSIYRRLPACHALDYVRTFQTIYTAEDAAQDTDLKPLADFLEGTTSILLLPLTASKTTYGLSLHHQEKRYFSAAEIELARTIGNQASMALVNADLYQSTLQTAQRLGIMSEVSYAISANLHLEDIYRATHEATAKLMPVEAFVIALRNELAGDIEAVYMVDLGQRIKEMRLPFGKGISGRVMAHGKPIITRQSAETELHGGITIGEKGAPHSIVAVPMMSAGRAIGALIAQSYQANAYTEDDQQLLSMLANQVTVAILNARLFDEKQKFTGMLEERVQERTSQLVREQRNTETLLRILSEVSASLDLDKTLLRTLELLTGAISAEQGVIMLVNKQDNKLHFRAGYNSLSKSEEIHTENATQIIGIPLSEWVVKHHIPVQIHDLSQDARWSIAQGTSFYRSALLAPLIIGEDVIGTIMALHHQDHFFGNDAFEMVKAIGSQVAIAIHNAQLYELTRKQADRLGTILRQQQIESSRQTAILEAVADGILVTDANNKITFTNVSIEQIMGLHKGQILNQSLANFTGLFGKAAQTWMKTVREWAEKPGERSGETYAEQITLDNEHIALVHVAPVIWKNEFLGTVAIFRDITHEVIVDRLKSEFVATVSHELRTPMTSIRGYVDLILMGAAGSLNEQQTHFLDIVKSNTERLNILVNDLLDISKIESGRVTLSIHVIKLAEIARDVVTELRNRAQNQNKPLNISIEIEKSLPDVLADPERIRQVLGNLLDNAYNYTPAHGDISVHLHTQDDNVQVDIADSGIGIPAEQQARIFERFFRGENPMVLATPGTGLGLAIVQQLVEMHHGKIWMKSAGIPGKGSTFSFTLPAHYKNEKE